MQTLYIKNMVCRRCIVIVEQTFRQLGMAPLRVDLGEVVLEEAPELAQLARLQDQLEAWGFSLLNDRKHQQVEAIKAAVIAYVREGGGTQMRLSEWVSARCGYEFSTLSRLFAETEGSTVEHYHLMQRIEAAKELLAYGELNVSEIAVRLGFSGTAHLSSQFRRLTGLSPSDFRRSHGRRIALDEV